MRAGSARAGFLLPIALAALFLAPAARADVVVIQESNGFPGAAEGEESVQKVSLAGDKLRVLDERHAWALYVRLDKRVVREASAVEKSYTEKPFSDFEKLRNDRETTRVQKVAEYKREVAKAKTENERLQLKKALENEMGLREDGTTVARTEYFPADDKKESIVTGDVKKEFLLKHYKIRENEGPAVFDVWVAPGLARPESILTFYEEVGTFSKPVLKEVLALTGFPVEVTAVLDNGNNKKTIHSKVLEIRDEKVDTADFDVPTGWKEVAPNAPKTGPAAGNATCEICGKAFAVDTGLRFNEPWSGKRHLVCTSECRQKLIQKLAAEQRAREEKSQNEKPK